MDVTGTTSASTNSGTAAASQTKFGANFDTFLQLLTAQLKNQDPLSPMDSTQFTQQLVQFSQVEQQINANQNLESLISLTKASAGTNAVAYLGKSLTVSDGSAALDDGEATWSYALNGAAADTRLVVTNAAGRTVYVAKGETGAGAHQFQWDGEDANGNALPPGAYTLTVIAKTSDGTAIDSKVTSQGVVSEVDLTGDEPQLVVGTMKVPLSKATLISGN